MKALKLLVKIIAVIITFVIIEESSIITLQAALQNNPGEDLLESEAVNVVYKWMQGLEDYEWGDNYSKILFADFDFDEEMELVMEYAGGPCGNREAGVYEITKKGIVMYKQGFDINELALYYNTKTKKKVFITKPFFQSGASDNYYYVNEVSITKGKLTDTRKFYYNKYKKLNDNKAIYTNYYNNKGKKISKEAYENLYKNYFAIMKKMDLKTYEINMSSARDKSEAELKRELKKSYETFSSAMISKKIDHISSSVNTYVGEIIFNSYIEYMQNNEKAPSSNKLKEVMADNYKGILTNQIKAIIAAENITDYHWDYLIENEPVLIGTTSYSKVQNKAKNLFGKSVVKIEFPIWKNRDNIDDFKMDLAKSKDSNVIYACSYDAENKIESEIIDWKKSSNGIYTITREYYYYTHWGNEKPDYTVKAIIKLKKNSTSSYGYNITSLILK